MFKESPDPSIDFEVDENLNQLGRLEKYYNTTFNLQRYVLARDIVDTCESSDYEDVSKKVVPLIKHFVHDKIVVVRQAISEHLFSVYQYLQDKESDRKVLKKLVLTHFLPLAFDLSVDSDEDVMENGIKTVRKFSKVLKNTKIRKKHFVDKMVVFLEEINGTEEELIKLKQRVVRLMCLLATTLGKEITKEHIFPTIVKLASHPNHNIRQTVAERMHSFSGVFNFEEFQKSVFPVFVSLAKDDLWCVRKSAIKSLTEISKNVPDKFRGNEMIGLFEFFRKDVSRWVKLEAYNQLGPFIATFSPSTVSDRLIKHFVQMVGEEGGGYYSTMSTDLIYFQAYNFPAIVISVGRKRWFQLEKLYSHLVRSGKWNIRKILASSISRIAEEIGEKHTESTLLPAVEYFLNDLNEVKYEAVKVLHKFMEHLGPNKRIELMTKVLKVGREASNWRIRKFIGVHSIHYTKICESGKLKKDSEVRKQILDYVIALLDDPYYEIRISVAEVVGELYQYYLAKNEKICEKELYEKLAEMIGKKWNRRQLYMHCCRSLIQHIDKDLFLSRFHPLIEKMKDDTVANARHFLMDSLKMFLKLENYNNEAAFVNLLKHVNVQEERSVFDKESDEETDDSNKESKKEGKIVKKEEISIPEDTTDDKEKEKNVVIDIKE